MCRETSDIQSCYFETPSILNLLKWALIKRFARLCYLRIIGLSFA